MARAGERTAAAEDQGDPSTFDRVWPWALAAANGVALVLAALGSGLFGHWF